MELLLLLPLLLVGGFVFGGSGGEDEDTSPEPDPDAGAIETGTSEAEEMSGTGLSDLLLGGRGGDLLEGLEGNDVLNGEFGNDTISGDAGNDIVLGADGNDLLDGSTGNDLVIGGAGDDSVVGNDGNDVLIGSSGQDTLNGGDGDDTLFGLEFADMSSGLASSMAQLETGLIGRYGSDVTERLLGRVETGFTSGDVTDTAPDLLNGGDGNDLLFGDMGDSLTGGAGIDDFAVGFRAGDAATQIADFDVTAESVLLLVSNPDVAVINFVTDGAGGTILTVDGQPAITFAGRTVASLTSGGVPWLFVDRL